MNLDELRLRWNEVLDYLESKDRIAWMAFFDARLASFDSNILILDFSDSHKLGGAHDYLEIRNSHRVALINTIESVLDLKLEKIEIL